MFYVIDVENDQFPKKICLFLADSTPAPSLRSPSSFYTFREDAEAFYPLQRGIRVLREKRLVPIKIMGTGTFLRIRRKPSM